MIQVVLDREEEVQGMSGKWSGMEAPRGTEVGEETASQGCEHETEVDEAEKAGKGRNGDASNLGKADLNEEVTVVKEMEGGG